MNARLRTNGNSTGWARAATTALLLAIVACGGCAAQKGGLDSVAAGAQAAPEPAVALPQPGPLALPAPADLQLIVPHSAAPRAASYVPSDLLVQGEAFTAALPHQRVTATAGGAAFDPNWRRVTSDPADLAYAMYSFDVPGYGGNARLYTAWTAAPPDWGDVWVALANWDEDRWDWYGMASDGTCALAGTAPYIHFGGALVACVVVIDTNPCELDWLRLGSLPPQPSLSATPTFGITPTTVSFDAGGSSDPDGSIAEYQWDPEGDGTFSESTGSDPTFVHEYAAAGDNVAAVRVLDNNGVYNSATIEISLREEVNFSYGSPVKDEHAKAVLVNGEGQLILFGSRSDFSFVRNVLVAVVNPTGDTGTAYEWGGNEEQLHRAVPAANGQFYACGSSGSYTTLTAGLLQQWSGAGELAWSKTVELADYSLYFWSLLVHDGQIYACGQLYSVDLERFFGLLCKFDTQGNFVWGRTIISPYNCTLRDIALSEPIVAGQTTLVVCGDYDISHMEPEALYATYDLDGNQLSCLTWGRPGVTDLPLAVSVAGVNPVPFVALRTRVEGQASIVLSSPGGATIELYRPGLETYLYDLHGTTLLATCALGLSETSAIVVPFSLGLELGTATEVSAYPDGSVFGACCSTYGGATIVSGSQNGVLPVAGSVELSSHVPSETWTVRTPSQGSPNAFVISAIPGMPGTPAGFEFNRQPTGDDDLIIHISR